jgi:hypothetical protein
MILLILFLVLSLFAGLAAAVAETDRRSSVR